MSEKTYDPQSRKWLLTINNPKSCELDHQRIIDILHLFHPDYFCMADEIATTGTYHTHVYLYSRSPIRFSTVKNRFPTAHIDKAGGTSMHNRNYIRKEGKYADTDKAETRVEGTFKEFGTPPSEEEERSPKMHQLLQNVKDGLSTTEIVDKAPSFCLQTQKIDQLRDTLESEPYLNQFRDLTVHYLYGATGVGKTRGIYQKHDVKDICRITDYGGRNGVRFDAYHSQPVLVFEEFHSQIPIEAMLNYLDIYPLMLPARYQDRVACYTTVYITSNISLEEQYRDIQRDKLETWRAFLRRINTVTEFMEDGTRREILYDSKRKNHHSEKIATAGILEKN